jgi:hypothetical protein
VKYLLGLVLCLLLIPLAKADGYQPNSVYLVGVDVYGPIQLFSMLDIGAGGYEQNAFGAALPLEGGIVGYSFNMQVGPGPDGADAAIGSLVSGGIDALGFCSHDNVIEYPPGYVPPDPCFTAPIDIYPYDNCFSPVSVDASDPQLLRKVAENNFAFVPGTYDGGLVVTGASVLEPGSIEFILIGLIAFALVAATSKKPQ